MVNKHGFSIPIKKQHRSCLANLFQIESNTNLPEQGKQGDDSNKIRRHKPVVALVLCPGIAVVRAGSATTFVRAVSWPHRRHG